MKEFKSNILKLINRFNSYIKKDTKKEDNTESNTKKKDNTVPDTKNNTKKKDTKKKDNTKPDTKPDTIGDTRASIKDKQKSIKNRYKSLLETRKTIENNIDSIYSALQKLPNESQSKLIELVRLDTILNDSINDIWCEIHERDKKSIKKIDINKKKTLVALYINWKV